MAFSPRRISSWLAFWARATRVYAVSASVVPVLTGTAYAWYVTGRFSISLFVLSMLAAVAWHLACNLINDYFDFRYGVDRAGTYGGSGMITAGALSAAEALRAAFILLVPGALIGIYLTFICGLPLLWIGIAGLLGLVFYTATPWAAKYQAMGEPLVFIMMGTLMVLGAYYVQTSVLSLNAALISLPVGFLVTAILQANDTRDISDDRESCIKTASIIFGAKGARAFLSCLIAGAYLSLALLLAFSLLPLWTALAMLSLPRALAIHRLYWSVAEEKSERFLGAVENTAKLHMIFGVLLSIGIVLGRPL